MVFKVVERVVMLISTAKFTGIVENCLRFRGLKRYKSLQLLLLPHRSSLILK